MQTSLYRAGQATRMPAKAFVEYVPSEQLESLSDEKLIDKCRKGDRAAFDALLKRYERPIYHLAYRLAGNYDDAHDIAAETFIRVYRAIGSFQCAITLPAWINRIVANVFYDTRRHAHRHPSVSLDALIEKSGDTFMNTVNADAKSIGAPEALAEANERKRILGAAIESLPDYQRTMVTLFHSDECTYEEIADIMAIPVGTVKSRLNRARLALRERLTPQMSALVS